MLDEQIDQAKKRIEANRQAINLGLLKKVNRAPRCARLKSNGQPCRAPAMGSRLFCVFHTHAVDIELNKEKMRIGLVENRESVQTAVKQIKEHTSGKGRCSRWAVVVPWLSDRRLDIEVGQNVQALKGKLSRSEADHGGGNAVESRG